MSIKVEKIKGEWCVFEVKTVYGTTFKTLIAKSKTRSDALKAAEK